MQRRKASCVYYAKYYYSGLRIELQIITPDIYLPHMIKGYHISFFIAGLLNFFSFFASAQMSVGTVSGKVIDSVSKTPVEFMTIALKKEKVTLKTTITDAEGNFSISNTPMGKLTIQAMAIGYTPKTIEVEVLGKTLDVGNIPVVPQTNNLKEIAINADRPLIKQEVDRITYNIQADPESKVLTALDMMRKVPLLSLDADDNIKLKGSGKYKILINGKPSGMINQSPKDVLRSMPASSIQKIEVITTPPAKYDSEGLSGIINIITSKKIDNGYNGNINIRENGPVGGPGVGGRLTLKQNKFGVSAYGGTGWFISPEANNESSRVTTGEQATSLLLSGTRKMKNNWRYGGAEFSYELDSLNLLTAELNPYSGYNDQTLDQFSKLRKTGAQEIGYHQLTKNNYSWSGLDAAFNYQLGFKSNKERFLTLSYKYTNFSNPVENALSFTERLNFANPDYTQNNDSRSKEQTFQLDYVHPLKKINIEAGLKGILRDNNSDYRYETFNGNGELVTDPERTNKFDNNQNIFGAYNSYGINLTNWSFKAGVRLEGTHVKANFISSGANVNTNYFNVIPTLSVNRKFKDQSNLNFGYTQRIERPGISFLNPFVDRSVPNLESTGNPGLEAVLSNNFELTYSKAKKGSVNAGISYNIANNTIQSISVYDETDQITHTTYQNVGKDKLLASSLNINYPITSKWNISISGNLGYKWLEGSIDGLITKNSGITGDGDINTSYKFEHEWKASASFSYAAPELLLQGNSTSYYFSSFGGSKEIIKDKLTLSVAVNNPFSKFRYYTFLTEGSNFVQTYNSQNYYRSFRVSLNWNFGKLSNEIKKSKRKIKNDDVKSSGS